ncbi:MAG: DUF1559 domain-containing protein [Aeoliella sp.]
MGRATKSKDITDGLSKTMAIGEKHLFTNRYELGDWHDDIGWTDGWDPDIMRYTGYQPSPDVAQGRTNPTGSGFLFGASHTAGFNAVFADGHVTLVEYDIDLVTFNAMGNRQDGLVVQVP